MHDIFSGYDTPDLPSELVKLEFDDDEGYNSTTEEFYDEDFEEIPVEDEPNFITLTKLQPVLPPVILMGGKVREDSEGMKTNSLKIFLGVTIPRHRGGEVCF